MEPTTPTSTAPEPAPSARRAYRSSVRTAQAAATRHRLLEAAGACFAENGYAGTSLRSIAERAGVSVETVQLNGPKADLLLASYEQSFAGEEGRTSLLERAAFRRVVEATTAADIVSALVDFMTEANARSAALAAAFDAAALSDPRIAQARTALGVRARADSRKGVEMIASRGGVRCGRPIDEVADELWFVLKAPHYLSLVGEAGWTHEQYRAWLDRTLRRLLC
jgi:AcrR family transcriptional regulator